MGSLRSFFPWGYGFLRFLVFFIVPQGFLGFSSVPKGSGHLGTEWYSVLFSLSASTLVSNSLKKDIKYEITVMKHLKGQRL